LPPPAQTERAEATAALFTRDGEQASSLYDMQAQWYEVAAGRAYLAQRQYGKALKRLLKVHQHFEDFQEDQFDFHGYCVRKMVRAQAGPPATRARTCTCSALAADIPPPRSALVAVCVWHPCLPAHPFPRTAGPLTVAPPPTYPRPPQTLRAYVSMLRMEDRLWAHPTYLKVRGEL
jgi:hypothetical protein